MILHSTFKLINAGNEYAVFVKEYQKLCFDIYQGDKTRKKLINQPSFIGTTNYIPYQRGGNEEKKIKLTSEDEDTDLPPAEGDEEN